VTHRVKDPLADSAVEVRDRITQRVVLQVADVGLTAGVGEHLKDVGLLPAVGLVADLPGPLALPDLLPLGLDLSRFVTAIAHAEEVTCGARHESGTATLRVPARHRWGSCALRVQARLRFW